MLARREREPPAGTRRELVADVEERLTDRHRFALQKASIGGFSLAAGDLGEELATSMDISPSTSHQHLRTAEGTVFASPFDQAE